MTDCPFCKIAQGTGAATLERVKAELGYAAQLS
jgi:hypothetical protein